MLKVEIKLLGKFETIPVKINNDTPLPIPLFVVVYLSIVIFVVFNEGAVRKIPIIYATSSNTTMRTKDQTHMPIKINSSGVIPVIFASSVLAAPRTVVSFMETSDVTKWINTIFNYQEPVGFVLYILMIKDCIDPFSKIGRAHV